MEGVAASEEMMAKKIMQMIIDHDDENIIRLFNHFTFPFVFETYECKYYFT